MRDKGACGAKALRGRPGSGLFRSPELQPTSLSGTDPVREPGRRSRVQKGDGSRACARLSSWQSGAPPTHTSGVLSTHPKGNRVLVWNCACTEMHLRARAAQVCALATGTRIHGRLGCARTRLEAAPASILLTRRDIEVEPAGLWCVDLPTNFPEEASWWVQGPFLLTAQSALPGPGNPGTQRWG